MTNKQLQRLARRYANAQFGPVLAQINADYARRARAGASSIAAGTSALAGQLAPFQAQTHAAYGQAKNEQAALDQAVLSSLTGAGQSAQADLNKQLGGIGAAIPNVAQYGAGAGAAAFGSGSANLSRLISQGAAAENYAGTLPAIARLGGASRLQDLQLQLEHGRQQEVGGLRAKIPGAVASIEQNLMNLDLQRGIAAQSGLLDQAKLQETASYHRASVGQRAEAARLRAAAAAAGISVEQAKLRESRRYHNLTAQGKQIANDIARYRAHHPRSTRAGGGITASAKAKYYAQGTEGAIAHKADGATAMQTYRYFANRGMPPRIAADIVGRVYGPWLKPGDKRRLGIR